MLFDNLYSHETENTTDAMAVDGSPSRASCDSVSRETQPAILSDPANGAGLDVPATVSLGDEAET